MAEKMSRLKPEDDQLWEGIFEEHGARMLMFARQFVKGRADAEDVLQEAFARMWKSGAIEKGGDKLIGRFYGCIRWTALDWLRRSRRRIRREERSAESELLLREDSWFDRSLENEELAESLQTALSDLPKPQREVVTLKIWGELTFDQIGEALEISPNTASSRYRYAMNALRGKLEGVCHV